MTARKTVDPVEGAAAVERVRQAYDSGAEPAPGDVRLAVKHLLGQLAAAHPGRSVEVRVPPYAAVQCIAGPRHTRGTPPNVVETDAETFLRLAFGRLPWADALATGQLHASGERSDLSPHLPIVTA